MRAILNVATGAELGFRRPRRTTVDNMDRKTFLRATLGASAGVLLAPPIAAAPSDGDLIDILSGPTACYRRPANWTMR
jgi:hypothetical protein